MGKRSKTEGEVKVKKTKTSEEKATSKPFTVEQKALDPTLTALFASSAGPVQAPPKARYNAPPPPAKSTAQPVDNKETTSNSGSDDDNDNDDEDDDDEDDVDDDNEQDEVDGDEDEDLSSIEGDIDDAEAILQDDEPDKAVLDASAIALQNEEGPKSKNKRKRKSGVEDDLEGQYMLKLQREEEKEEEERQAERRLKRQRTATNETTQPDASGSDVEEASDSDEADEAVDAQDPKALGAPVDVPVHESLMPTQDKETTEIEKASRTVFLANVSTACITDKKSKKELLDHMGSFLDSLPPPKDSSTTHKVDSIRFRSTAYASTLPKKASYATKNLMDATTKSTNAYVVYTTAFAAREAVKRLNGTIVLDRHLRVDGVAHPAKTDHRRCVFVGNLGFVDDESLMDQGGEDQRKRSKIPSDVEEGLWRQFSKAGKVESVRVVRDEKTRVGKGFAYVQFEDANSVEAALLFHEKKYPPMLPRILRVVRAKAMAKTALASQRAAPKPQRPQPGGNANPNNQAIYNPKMSAQQQSLQGRASKLLGKAGAAQFNKRESEGKPPRPGMEGLKTPENVVMEGYRASAKNGKPKDLKFGKGGKKAGKPGGRSAKRGGDWKKSGGKKTKA